MIEDDCDASMANVFCFGAFADKNTGVMYHDMTGNFPFMAEIEVRHKTQVENHLDQLRLTLFASEKEVCMHTYEEATQISPCRGFALQGYI